MKWTDIKNRFKKIETPSVPTGMADAVRPVTGGSLVRSGISEQKKKLMLITLIFAIIIGVGITLIFAIKKRANDPYRITKQEWQFINEFFAQNPPKPLTTEEQQITQTIITQPVTVSPEEDQFVNKFLQGR